MEQSEIMPNFFDLGITAFVAFLIWFIYKDYTAPPKDKYRTFWPRFCAPTIDELILWVPLTLVPSSICLALDLNETGSNILFVTSSMMYFVYSIYFHGKYGATVGKMKTKVRVVCARTEGPITMSQAFCRDSVPIVLFIILFVYVFAFQGEDTELSRSLVFIPLLFLGWFFLEVVTMLTNEKRRALHDFIAGTVVVRTNMPSNRR